jgi:hypothetical protein
MFIHETLALTNYRNNIFALLSSMFHLLSDMYYMVLGGIYIFTKGHAVLIKCCHVAELLHRGFKSGMTNVNPTFRYIS